MFKPLVLLFRCYNFSDKFQCGKFFSFNNSFDPLSVNRTKWSNTLKQFVGNSLALPVPYISEICIEIKIKLNFLISQFFVVPQKVPLRSS